MLASDSEGSRDGKQAGHRNHFRLLLEEGSSWSGREPNVLFLNRGDGVFDEVGNVAGLALRLDSRGVAAGDLDGDGDLDLLVYNRNNPTLRIYRNDTPGQGNVLQVALRNVKSNPGAVGAQLVLHCGAHRMLRQTEAGAGFLSQNDAVIHFGLGGCRAVDRLEIRWPSGLRQELRGLPANHRVTVTEGADGFEAVPLRPRNFNQAETEGPDVESTRSAPRPDLRLARIDAAGELALAELDAETVLLNFWATWCSACAAELDDLLRLQRTFADKNVRFVGVCMDEREKAAAVRAFIREKGFSFEHVWGDLEAQRPFASLANAPLGALPLTAIVHRGVVQYVHAGRVDVARVTKVLKRLAESEKH